MKKVITLILVLLLSYSAQAQLHGNKWRFGLSMGTTNYVGDIRPMPLRDFNNLTKLYNRNKTYSEQFSYQASLEYALGNSVGLMLTAGSYQFGSGDRFIQNDGSLLTESPSFDRALNFQTNLYDAGLSFVIKPDNNWLLSGNSFFAPYLTLGIGVQTFDVSGDLLDANGNRYDYTNQNTIPDGRFETPLASLGTERTDGYNRTTLYANLGLGVRFRITKSIEIFAQSDFKRAATDYLDDVSGQYRASYDNDFQEYAAKPGTNLVNAENRNRGFNDGKGDWYIYHGIGLKFSFGANKAAFKPPVITQRYTYIPTELTKIQLEAKPQENNVPSQTTNNYFTVVQLPGIESKAGSKIKLDSTQLIKNQVFIDSLSLMGEEFDAEMEKAETELSSLNQAITLAERDSSVSENIQAARLQVLGAEKSISEGKMTSISFLKNRNQFKIDSLMNESQQVEISESTLDSAAMIRELIIYPGQVSRILYSANSQAVLQLDSASQKQSMSPSSASAETMSTETMSRKEFETEMGNFRSEMLQAQAKRDSAMMMAFASRSQVVADEQPEIRAEASKPQEVAISQGGIDSKTAQKVRKNNEKAIKAEENARKQQEKIEKKNNELLKDALLVGGAVAVTAAVTSDKKEKETPVDSTQVISMQEPEILDSTAVSATPVPIIAPVVVEPVIRVDTVFVENEKQVLLRQAKMEVYFETNQFTLSESEIAKLAPIKDLLNSNPDENLELVGFADNTGSIAYNLALTEKRVESVKKILIETYQIPAERINTGDGGLIVRGKSKGAQEQDRKVEIRLTLK